jgi:hypothetical protein
MITYAQVVKKGRSDSQMQTTVTGNGNSNILDNQGQQAKMFAANQGQLATKIDQDSQAKLLNLSRQQEVKATELRQLEDLQKCVATIPQPSISSSSSSSSFSSSSATSTSSTSFHINEDNGDWVASVSAASSTLHVSAKTPPPSPTAFSFLVNCFLSIIVISFR